MNMSFVDRFVHNQLDVLPPAIQGEKEDPFYEESAEMILKAIIYYVFLLFSSFFSPIIDSNIIRTISIT